VAPGLALRGGSEVVCGGLRDPGAGERWIEFSDTLIRAETEGGRIGVATRAACPSEQRCVGGEFPAGTSHMMGG
jgi:hypothetical protein